MKFYIKDFFGKCDQIRRKLRIWSYLLKKSLMNNLISCAVFCRTDIRASKGFHYLCSKKSLAKFHMQPHGQAHSIICWFTKFPRKYPWRECKFCEVPCCLHANIFLSRISLGDFQKKLEWIFWYIFKWLYYWRRASGFSVRENSVSIINGLWLLKREYCILSTCVILKPKICKENVGWWCFHWNNDANLSI